LDEIMHQITGKDFPPNPLDKPGYQLEFHDEFMNDALDMAKWLPYYLPHWSSRNQSAARYSLSGSSLRLYIEEGQLPWCPVYDGDIRVSALQTGCFSGPAGSSIGQHHFRSGLVVSESQPRMELYTPQYGYFEIRMKAVPISGYMVALWMIGFEDQPEKSAEICICEIFGRYIQDRSARIGYGIHPFNDPSLQDEFYRDVMPLSAENYHIYAAEWTPKHVDFYIDNQKTRTILQSPSYPMQFMLTFYEIPDHLTPEAGAASWPKIFEVDYVRGYRPINGYGG
jgi:hypothetical protein